jgi:hypothetical protein
MRRALIGTTLAAGLLVLAGCKPFGGGDSSSATTPPPLSGSDVEKTINDKLPSQLHGVQNAGGASCPDKVALGQNKTVECSMVADGQKVKIKVQQDGSGYQVSLDQAVVSDTVLEQNLASTYHQKFTFYCGRASVRIVNPGDKIQCQGTPADGGKPTQFDVTIQDTSGRYSAKVHNS